MNQKIRTQKISLIAKPAVVLGAIAFLTGCNEFKGQIEVQELLNLHVVKGENTVPPGIYGVKMDFPEKGKVRLEIGLKGKKNNPRAYFRIGSKYFPKYNGPINISSVENGQAYDLVGDLQTDIQESREQYGTETCSFTIQHRVCQRDAEGRPLCTTQTELISGRQDIRYFDRTTRQFLRLDLQLPSTSHTVAKANGTQTDSERIITFRGTCMDLSGRDIGWHQRRYEDECRHDGGNGDGWDRPSDRYGDRPDDRGGVDGRIGRPDDRAGRRGDIYDRDGDGICDKIIVDALGRRVCALP